MSQRYMRQILMSQIGEEGQKKIEAARVLVVGAGGLGSPVLYYLAAAGVGTIGIADMDIVSETNLNRQILHYEKDIDVLKTKSAYEKLVSLNSKTVYKTISEKITEENIDGILDDYDIVVDCVDNLPTRHIVNKHALGHGMHVIEAGVDGNMGFVITVKPGEACFGCIKPNDIIQPGPIPIIGATAGVTGCLQATECIKVIVGYGEPLYSKMLYFNLDTMDFNVFGIKRKENCPCCGGVLYGS